MKTSIASLVFSFLVAGVCLWGTITCIQHNSIGLGLLNGIFFVLNLYTFVRGLQTRMNSSEG